jgi:hypothetical protein
MDTKTSLVSPKCQRGSSFVIGNMFVFVLVNPLAATPLFSPSSLARAALFGLVVYMPRGRTVAPAPDSPKGPVRQCTIGTSPLSIRWWILEACIPSSPVTVSARTCQQWQVPLLVMDPSDVARRIVESNLRVVWRGSQRVNLSVCMYYVTVKCGGIVGGGGTIKQFLLRFLLLCIDTCNKIMFSSWFNIFLTTLNFYIYT